MRGYIICGEARCGSSFLARALHSTNLMGRPYEYFSRAGCRREMLADPERGLARLLEAAVTPNGVYGIKLFSQQFDLVAPANWVSRLPNLHFVHLERDDLLGQAISLVRAQQTQRYMSGQKGAGAPRYDAAVLRRALGEIAIGQARWRAYFAANGIRPLHLRYEALAADPEAGVAAIARHMGLAEVPIPQLETIGMDVQRDALSDDWRRRFHGEGDLNRLHKGDVRSLLAPIRRLRQRLSPAAWRDRRSWGDN